MPRTILVALIGMFSSSVAMAQAAGSAPKPGEMVHNPPYSHWVQFKVGASVTVKDRVTLSDGTVAESTVTSTLLSKSKDSAKVETVSSTVVRDQGATATEKATVVSEHPPLVKYEATQSAPGAGYTVTTGTEILEVNGKKLDAEWVEARSTDGDENMVEKIWTVREIPGGLVKRTMTKKRKMGTVTTETSLVTYQGVVEATKK